MRGRLACASVLAFALVGCGSTVPLAQQRTANGLTGPGDGSGTTTTSVGSPGAPAPGSPAAGAGTAVGSRAATGSSSGSTGVGTTTLPPASGGRSGAVGRGAPVEVGFAYAENAAAFGKALGGSVDLGDGKAQNDALVAYVNAHGGLAGHPVKPVYYAVDLTRPDPWSVFVQEACSLWTEDHHVIAASFPVNIDIGQLSTCLRKHGAILDASSLRLRSQSDYTTSPLLVEPWMITDERLAPLYVRGLQQQGYFTGKPVVGLLTYDYPQSELFARLITAELRKIGITVKATFTAQYADSTSGLGNTIAQVQSAVVKFRSAGVTHVMSSAIPGGIGVAFQPAAQSQGYHPHYGLTSFDAIAGMSGDQVTNAMAVGWWLDDVDAQHELANPTTKLCRSIFRTNNSAGTRDKELLALVYCDFVLMLQHASAGLAPTARIDGPTLVQRLDEAGPAYRSSRALGTVLSSAQRDGASGLRGLSYQTACTCWVYGRPVT